MGVDLNGAQLLLRARQNGVCFSRLATLGRQGLHANRPALISLLRRRGVVVSQDMERRLLDPTAKYSEAFFTLLGAEKIAAIDANDYESAQIVHDLNVPIGDSLASSFDTVFDGGTLEHVFNFPTAISNAMQMVTAGGHFLSIAVANNFSGHGFYQFSPELFYRLLSRENGYKPEACLLWEEVQGSKFFVVPDPDSRKGRIEVTSESGTYMFFQALRIGDLSRDYVPQQSDYVTQWTVNPKDQDSAARSAKWKSALKRIKPVVALVQFSRRQRQSDLLRPRYVEAEYRQRRISRNSNNLMTPLEKMKVLL